MGGQTPEVQPSQKNVWGGSEAPDWVKASKLDKTHDAGNVAAGTPTKKDEPDQGAVVTPTSPAVIPPTPTTVTPPAPVAAPAPAATITPETLAQALGQFLPRAAVEKPGGQQMSDAEIREQLAVFEASEADYEQILGVKPQSPAQLAAFNRVLQAISKQSVTIANVMNQRALQQLQEQNAPYIAAIRSQEAERQRTIFYSENKELAGYEALVELEFKNLQAEGRRFASVTEARKEVAERTKARLKAIGITPSAAAVAPTNGQASTQSQSTTSPSPSTRQMTTTSVGGRGGGSATGQEKPANKVEQVWGKR